MLQSQKLTKPATPGIYKRTLKDSFDKDYAVYAFFNGTNWHQGFETLDKAKTLGHLSPLSLDQESQNYETQY